MPSIAYAHPPASSTASLERKPWIHQLGTATSVQALPASPTCDVGQHEQLVQVVCASLQQPVHLVQNDHKHAACCRACRVTEAGTMCEQGRRTCKAAKGQACERLEAAPSGCLHPPLLPLAAALEEGAFLPHDCSRLTSWWCARSALVSLRSASAAAAAAPALPVCRVEVRGAVVTKGLAWGSSSTSRQKVQSRSRHQAASASRLCCRQLHPGAHLSSWQSAAGMQTAVPRTHPEDP